jgi:hypothetical protein
MIRVACNNIFRIGHHVPKILRLATNPGKTNNKVSRAA